MNDTIHIYCDESCHLEHDQQKGDYYMLKTAYAELKSGRRAAFEAELSAYRTP
jgi:hypothetical protein